MNYSFNVEEFSQIIDNVASRSATAEETLIKISGYITKLMSYIGNKENPSLYQAWADLKENISKVYQKYVERKESFLSELSNFKEVTLVNNDEVYQSISEANQRIMSIAQQLENL